MESYRFTRLGLSETFVALVIMTPATIFFAWIFFAFCERPYLGSSSVAIRPGNSIAKETEPGYFKISQTHASLLAANPVESGQSGQIFR
jgi:hypothetical protein